MAELIPFKPGTTVCMINNPIKKGIVTATEPFYQGSRIKQEVAWEGMRKELVNIASIRPDNNLEPPSIEVLLTQGHYGRCHDLQSAITRYRLSGVLDNLIYSLNVTNTEFLPYQFQPLLTFLNSFGNSLLIADEVGLGKTIEAGLIWTELRMRQRAQRLMVVCPSALCNKWKKELAEKFLIQADVIDVEGFSSLIDLIATGLCRSKVVIASMQTMRPPKGWDDEEETSKKAAAELSRKLRDIDLPLPLFDMLIVDEAHHFRNEDTKGHDFIEVLRPHCTNAIFLSATPVQTGSDNLHTLLNLLDEETFNDPTVLDNLIYMNSPLIELITKLQSGELDKDDICSLVDEIQQRMSWSGYDQEVTQQQLDALKTSHTVSSPTERLDLIKRLNRLNPLNQFMNRSLKRFVQKTRVKRDPQSVSIMMTDVEKRYYDHVTSEIVKYAHTLFNNPNKRNNGVVGFVLTLAQQQMASCLRASYKHWISNENFDPEEVEDLGDPTIETTSEENKHPLKQLLRGIATNFDAGEELLKVDSKFDRLLEVIRNYQDGDHSKKIIIFSFYKKTIAYLEERMKGLGMNVISVSGDVAYKDRDDIFERFQYGEPSILLSTEVASEGLDLQFVSCLINYDLPWNPAKIEQRIGRIDRIGQKNPKILIFNFVYQGSIEERIFARLYNRVKDAVQILGYSEEVLGDIIEKLSKKIFSLSLTPQEEEEEVKRAELAIQNLENQKDETEGMSMVYDLMQQSVRNAQEMERYVLDEDLLSFVDDFCNRDPEHSRLIRDYDINHEPCYKLVLSVGAHAGFEQYLERHAGETDTTYLFANPNTLLKFKNKKGGPQAGTLQKRGRDPNVEIVTQTHPLIGFISEWWDKQEKSDNTKKTAAVIYAPSGNDAKLLKAVPQGIYAYQIDFWSDHGIKDTKFRKGLLAYRVRNVETNELLDKELGELLVNKASRYGNNWANIAPETNEKCCCAHDENKDCLVDDFASYRLTLKQQREEETQFKLQQYKKQIKSLDFKYEEQLRKFEMAKLTADERKDHGLKGRMVRAQNNYNREHQRLEVSVRKMENILQEQQQVTQETISVGIIDFKRS